MTARITLIGIATVMLLAVSGCGGDDADTRSETAGMPSILQELQNDEWVLDQAASTPRIDSTRPVTLSFTADAVHGSGPCNRFRGVLDIAQHSVEDDAIEISRIASTRKSCGDAADRAETAWFAALEAVTKVDVDRQDERLTLTGPGGVRLRFRTADERGN
jgi:heat shock protein HslJ